MVKYLDFLWMIITVSYIINGTTGQPMDDQRNYCHKIYPRYMKNLESFLCFKTCIWMEEGVISRQGVLNLNSLKFKMKFNDLDARKLFNFEMCLRMSFENLMIKKCEDIAKVYSCYASITTLPFWNMYNKRIAGGVGQSLYNNVEGFPSRRGRKSYVTKNPNERFIFMLSSSANKLVSKILDPIFETTAGILLSGSKMVFPKIVTDAIEGLAIGFNSFIEGIEYGIKSTLDLITDGLEYSIKFVYTHVLSPFMEGFRASMEAKKNKQKNNSSFMRSFSSTSPGNKVVNPTDDTPSSRFINFKNNLEKVTDSVKTIAGSAGNVAGTIVGSIGNAANSLLSINNPIAVDKNREDTEDQEQNENRQSVILAIDVGDFFSTLHDVLPMLVDYIGPNLASATGEIAKEVTASIVPNVMQGINKLVNQIIEDLATNIAATAPSILKEAENISTSTIMQLKDLIIDIHKIITKNEKVLLKNDE